MQVGTCFRTRDADLKKTGPVTQTLYDTSSCNLDLKPLGPCKSEPLKKLKSCRFQMFFKIDSIKNCNIYRETPVLGSLFNKVAGLKVSNFFKNILQHRCFLCIVQNF